MSAARILVLLILAAGASLAAPGVNAWQERSAGFELAPKAAARLERRLESGKGDAGDRIRLLAWYSKQIESEEGVAIREKRIPLILWLVEHADAHIPLHGSICVADMHPAGDPYADEAGYGLVKKAWLAKVEQSPENLAITAQAMRFLFAEEPERAIRTVAKLGMEPEAGALVAQALLGIGRRRYDDCRPMAINSSIRESSFGEQLRNTIRNSSSALFHGSLGTTLRTEGSRLYTRGLIDWDYTELANAALSRASEAMPAERPCWSPDVQLPPRKQANEAGGASQRKSPARRVKVTSARLIEQPNPVYPKHAIQQGIDGTVLFQASIGCSGRVLWLGYAGGPAELVDSARSAVARWRYSPTLVDNKPVGISTVLEVNFKLP